MGAADKNNPGETTSEPGIDAIIDSSTDSLNTCFLSAQKVPGPDLGTGYEQNAPALQTLTCKREKHETSTRITHWQVVISAVKKATGEGAAGI